MSSSFIVLFICIWNLDVLIFGLLLITFTLINTSDLLINLSLRYIDIIPVLMLPLLECHANWVQMTN